MKALEATDCCRVMYPTGRRDAAVLSRFPSMVFTLPGAVVYGWAVRILRRNRMRGRGAGWDGVAVISIGNIEVGGNGKTPFAIHLIPRLQEAGYRPAYVSRGFMSVAERLGPVTVFLPPGHGGEASLPSGVRLLRGDRGLAGQIGDEGAMLAMRYPGTPLVFSRDRARAVDIAVHWLRATHVILDDAFQTWQVYRDVDIVLVDGRRPFGNGRLVPAGTLREEPGALSRAALVGVNGVAGPEALLSVRETVRAIAGRELPVFGLRRGVVFVDREGRRAEPPKTPCAALSSIARPAAFDRLLAAAGVDVGLSVRYPDHHPYRPGDVRRIREALVAADIPHVVTTEKDWVKLRELELPFACTIARLELEIVGADVLPIIEKPQVLPAAS